MVAYVDNADNFKVYKNGDVKTLEIGSVRNYVTTNNLLAYSMTDILKVYDNGKVKTLSPNVKDFAIGDISGSVLCRITVSLWPSWSATTSR